MSYMAMKEVLQEIDRKDQTPSFLDKRMNIPKVQPLQHIQLSNMLEAPGNLDSPFKLACSIYANVLDTTDRVIVDAAIKWAEANGGSDLYILDREFVKAALLEKVDRDKGADRWIDDGPASKCPTCGFSCNDEYYLGAGKFCPECGQRLKGLCGRED